METKTHEPTEFDPNAVAEAAAQEPEPSFYDVQGSLTKHEARLLVDSWAAWCAFMTGEMALGLQFVRMANQATSKDAKAYAAALESLTGKLQPILDKLVVDAGATPEQAEEQGGKLLDEFLHD